MKPNDRLPQSDEEWQRRFEEIRNESILAQCGSPLIAFAGNDTYATFVSGVLETIRAGGTDYCFFIYQIEDLLKFEKERLQTSWLPNDKCFKVWLSANIHNQLNKTKM